MITDPAQNTQQLSEQLRAMGLYPAQTLGDGNCLFRALSDQFYGSPSRHFQLREEICDWLEQHKERYAPFVDDDRGLDVHLRCMRQPGVFNWTLPCPGSTLIFLSPGTYGGHLELTAFAHLKKRDVKVIQPGLVYVIEWMSGADLSPTTSEMPKPPPPASEAITHSSKDARKVRREKKKELKDQAMKNRQEDEDEDAQMTASGTVYVACAFLQHRSCEIRVNNIHSLDTMIGNIFRPSGT